MAYCKYCGGQVPDGTQTCPNCGGTLDGTAQNAQQNTQQTPPPPGGSFMGADTSSAFDGADLANNKWCYILAYLWILFFLPLVVCPDSKVGRFHANQGLLIFIFTTACQVLAGLLGVFGGIPFIGALFGILAGILGWASGVIHLAAFIFALVNILDNKAVELPLIGKYRLIK